MCTADKGPVTFKRRWSAAGSKGKTRQDNIALLIGNKTNRTVRGRLVFKRGPVGNQRIGIIGRNKMVPVAQYQPLRLFVEISGIKPGTELVELSARHCFEHGFGNRRV